MSLEFVFYDEDFDLSGAWGCVDSTASIVLVLFSCYCNFVFQSAKVAIMGSVKIINVFVLVRLERSGHDVQYALPRPVR